MATAAGFPGQSVISSFKIVEGMCEEVLRHVPYTKKHEDVWSPQLATILMEACSQLDSLWKYQVVNTPGSALPQAGQNINVTHYFVNLGAALSPEWVVFWGEAGERVEPFTDWSGASSYVPIDWWLAYNDVKHDRLANREKATMKHAVHALAGLFIAILKCPFAAPALAHEGWADRPPKPTSGFLMEDQPAEIKAAESRLFSYIVGVDRKGQAGKQGVGTYGSPRLYLWCKCNNSDHDLEFK